jgi:hypothetical protein
MLAHNSDLVAFVLGKKVGRCQARNTSTFTGSASFRIDNLSIKTHPTTTIVFAILICHVLFDNWVFGINLLEMKKYLIELRTRL